MMNIYDLYDDNVGDTYKFLLQIRDNKIYTGNGVLVDLPLGPGDINTSGSGAGSYEENITEEIILSSSSQYLLMLEDAPITIKPINVIWNGLYLKKGPTYDFVVSQNTIQINPEHQLEAGDFFTITYSKLSYV